MIRIILGFIILVVTLALPAIVPYIMLTWFKLY
jgi:hypothetical protein